MIAWYWLIPTFLIPCIGMWVSYKLSARFFAALTIVNYQAQGYNDEATLKHLEDFFDNHRIESAFKLMFNRDRYGKLTGERH